MTDILPPYPRQDTSTSQQLRARAAQYRARAAAIRAELRKTRDALSTALKRDDERKAVADRLDRLGLPETGLGAQSRAAARRGR